jgi:DNA-binding CsgD family transcriptional regulator
MERRLNAIEGMLDHFGQAAILVSAGGALAHANAAGEALVRKGDVLVESRGSLSARSSASALKLRRAIAQACAPYGMEASLLLIERPIGRPLAVSIVPFRAAASRQALLIIEDDSRTAAGVAPRLRSLYGLTPAEAEIGSRIADGVSPVEIANERGVSVETVRSQIKSLSAKLGCARQSEIVALVRALPAPSLVERESASHGGSPFSLSRD